MASNEPRITHDNGAIVMFSNGAVHDRVNYETQHPGESRPKSSRSGIDPYASAAYRNTPTATGAQPVSRHNRINGQAVDHPAYQRGLQSAQEQTQRRSGR